MDESIRFLFEIVNNPHLFIGNDGLIALSHFMNGFITHQRLMNARTKEADEMHQSFSEYVHDKLNDRRTVSLYRCINDNTKTDDEAFALFYSLLHEFYDEKQQKA